MDHDQDNLDRLREQARRRMEQDERAMPPHLPAYGAPPPPAPVYGGPPVRGGPPRGPVTVYGAPPVDGGFGRRRGLKYILIALLAAIAGALAWIFGRGPGPLPMAVYGGPPITPVPPPADSTKSTAPTPTVEVYGAPPLRQKDSTKSTAPPKPVYGGPPPRPPVPRQKDSTKSTRPTPPAAVYGGPPPRPQGPPK